LSENGDCPKPDNAANEDILIAEVRRLKGVIAAGESEAIAKCDCPGQERQVLVQKSSGTETGGE